MTLEKLEKDLQSVFPNQQENLALLDIAQYLNLKNNKLEADLHTQYLAELQETYKSISENLPAAMLSPSIYVREWAKFINNNEVI